MKVLFVYSLDDFHPSRKKVLSWSRIPLGISYIAALLRAHGHESAVVVLGSAHYDSSIEELEASVAAFNPGLFCFSAVFSQHPFLAKIARHAKSRWPERYLVAGGVHATLRPEEVIAGPFDAVCIGEGEYPTLELCRQLQSRERPTGIANLWIKSAGGRIEKNPPREFLRDLDGLPFPDLTMWKPWVSDDFEEGMTVLGGRGCPYDCTYCCNDALRKTATGRYVRTRSAENIVEEIRQLGELFPDNKEIYLEVETLDCDKAWTIELCDRLKALNASLPAPIAYGSNYRINPRTIDESLFSALRQANFQYLNIGLESGSERVRRETLNRSYTNEDFFKVVSLARKHRLKIYLYNMIGLPGESLADHKETVAVNRQCQPDGHYTGIFYPYPGTSLYDRCIREGLIEEPVPVLAERSRPVMGLPGFSKARIRRAYIWFDYYVYRGYKTTWTILSRYTLDKTRSGRMAKHIWHRLRSYTSRFKA